MQDNTENFIEHDLFDESKLDTDSLEIDDSIFSEIPDEMLNETDKPLDPLIENRDSLKVGLTPEDIKSLYEYMSGDGEKPLFIDKFTSDSEGRLKDMIYVMNLIQLSRIPTLTALQAQVQERLFSSKNLYSMNIRELTAASSNITKELQGIIKASTETFQTFNALGSLNNEYRNLLNRLMLMPEEKITRIKEIINRED